MILGLAAAGMMGLASVASAATVYAQSVPAGGYNPGLRKNNTAVPAPRNVASNALGAPDASFTSLGFGGTLKLSFQPFAFGPPAAMVFETTGGTYPLEAADVWISVSGIGTPTSDPSEWNYRGSVNNAGANSVTVPLGGFHFVFLKDISNPALFEATADGFDVNAVGVTPIPLPAAAWAGIALLGVGGALRRRVLTA
jgi:hypothetical protein